MFPDNEIAMAFVAEVTRKRFITIEPQQNESVGDWARTYSDASAMLSGPRNAASLPAEE